MNKTRILNLPQATYDDSFSIMVDSETSGTMQMTLPELFTRGQTTIDVPDDPPGVGYEYMAITTFKDPESQLEYKSYDILTPKTLSTGVNSIPLPDVINLGATTYESYSANPNLKPNFFDSSIKPGSVQSNPVLMPTALTASILNLTNKHIRIVTRTATPEEMGVNAIYEGDPFSGIHDKMSYVFASPRIDLGNAGTHDNTIVINFSFVISSEALTQAISYGYIVDDDLNCDDVISSQTGVKNTYDPDNKYRALSAYEKMNVTDGSSYEHHKYRRKDRENMDFAFTEDFTLAPINRPTDPTYDALIHPIQPSTSYIFGCAHSIVAQGTRSFYSLNTKQHKIAFSKTRNINPKAEYVDTGKYNQTSSGYNIKLDKRIYLKNARSLRFVIGTRFSANAGKIAIKSCHLGIYTA